MQTPNSPSGGSVSSGQITAQRWAGTGPATSLTGIGVPVTLVEGDTFCVSNGSGDIATHQPHGLFVLDTRVLSRWELHVSGGHLEPLATTCDQPFHATFLGRTRPRGRQEESELLVTRRRDVGHGMREQIEFRNFGQKELHVTAEIHVDADFADVFEVKDNRVKRHGQHRLSSNSRWLSFEQTDESQTKRVTVHFSLAAEVEPGRITWRLEIPPKGLVEICIECELAINGVTRQMLFPCGGSDISAGPTLRKVDWHEQTPVLETSNAALQQSIASAINDLGALQIVDPEHPQDSVIAAGAPWFMTLFGRDSLLTSWMALIADPTLARGVLTTLARLQGQVVDDATEEEPGRIIHEIRFENTSTLSLGGGSRYYGTADATPLFVMLAGELRRWGIDEELVQRLQPHISRALDWIEQYGDKDGDGYVEYDRRNSQGLINQGWKDSWDGINFADGRLAEAPIALCEVQAYVYAAYLAGAHFALEAGDHENTHRYQQKAADLKLAFNRDFWLEDRGWFAVGLDAHKEPIDALTSNIGHCLWTGIADEDKAAQVADQLLRPEMFSGWGIRTLATTMARYNPVSYHNGSVWPHDTAICVAGLTRYGYLEHAHRVTQAMLDVSEHFDGRLPELFAGIGRDELSAPAPYPASCSPQAWAAASPLLLVRSMLRLDPWARQNRIHVDPRPPRSIERLDLHGVRINDRKLDFHWHMGKLQVDGLDGMELLQFAHPTTQMTEWEEQL